MLAYESILHDPKGTRRRPADSRDRGQDILQKHLDRLAKKGGGK